MATVNKVIVTNISALRRKHGPTDDREFLYVVGSGMFSMKIHVDSLPFANGR